MLLWCAFFSLKLYYLQAEHCEHFNPYKEKWAEISQDPTFHGGGKSHEHVVPRTIFIAADENYSNHAYLKVILRAYTVYSHRGNREALSQKKENVWGHQP